MKKRLFSLLLAAALALSVCALPAAAKTVSSDRADYVFFYAKNAAGKSVLLKVMPLSDLKKLSHGQADGSDYSISTTDNYPTTQYCEARGFTIPELVDYVKSVTTVQGASGVSFSGGDTIRLMATDSYGNYSRSWSCEELYGVKRYYFEGLYDASTGWNTGWEVAGENQSKMGVTLEDYNSTYRSGDRYYANKRAVLAGGKETTVVLATESYSGRTTSQTLSASTEPGIASYVTKNGGTVAGCLRNVLSDEYALRLSLPMTEADLMAAHRTAYDNFKWIYNLQLDMADTPALPSLGTVAEPVPTYRLSGNTLTISFSCATPGASIYYGYAGAPQTLYTGPITVDVTGRDLTANPVTVCAAAVREGWDDAGVLTFKYPGAAPSFQTVYSGMIGSGLTLSAAAGVSAADWTAWTKAMNFISMKAPSAGGYQTLNKSDYSIDNAARTITFHSGLFTETGSYSFLFHATKYANKGVSVTMKRAAPAVKAGEGGVFGGAVTLTFDDQEYQKALSVYVSGTDGSRTMIPSNDLDRTQAGQVRIKAEYFALPSAAIRSAGTYTLELINNNYSPASQSVPVTLKSGFTDVPADAWCAGAVAYVTERGLFAGTGAATFSPNRPLTRAMFVTVLWRLAGSPKTAGDASFTDVPAGAWCAGAVAWASANKIVTGLEDGSFAPNASITRQQLAVLLCRYAAFSGDDTTATEDLSRFTDADSVSGYARSGVAWAVEHKVINGTSATTLSPRNTTTRAQVAQMLTNYLKAGA